MASAVQALIRHNLASAIIVRDKLARLTSREKDIARLVTQGFSNKKIAYNLGITEGTVKVYLTRLYMKHGIDGRFELAYLYMNKRERIGDEN